MTGYDYYSTDSALIFKISLFPFRLYYLCLCSHLFSCLVGDFFFYVLMQHVRRAAVLALSTFAHNKPNLIKGLLPELLPLLYDQTVIKVC